MTEDKTKVTEANKKAIDLFNKQFNCIYGLCEFCGGIFPADKLRPRMIAGIQHYPCVNCANMAVLIKKLDSVISFVEELTKLNEKNLVLPGEKNFRL